MLIVLWTLIQRGWVVSCPGIWRRWGGGLLKNVDGVGGAFRGGAGCLYRGFRVDCRSGRCGLAVAAGCAGVVLCMVGARRWGCVIRFKICTTSYGVDVAVEFLWRIVSVFAWTAGGLFVARFLSARAWLFVGLSRRLGVPGGLFVVGLGEARAAHAALAQLLRGARWTSGTCLSFLS